MISESVSVPPNATVPCGRKSFAAESKELFVIDNRPSQSALLSYVHQSAHSRTPAPSDDDDASFDREEGPLGQWRQKALAPPDQYEDEGDSGSRTIVKSKAPNYRSIDDDETAHSKDVSKKAKGDPYLVINAWLTVSVLGRCRRCWEIL